MSRNIVKFKMSHIIHPMMLEEKHTAEQIADAVIEKFPEANRDKLIVQIKGPRLFMLKRDQKKKHAKIPSLVKS